MSQRNRTRVERLADAMRRAGAHRLPQDLVEERLGRAFNNVERRAYQMARDTKRHKDGAKASHYGRQIAILQAGQFKRAMPPKPPGMDPAPSEARTYTRFSGNRKTDPLPDRPVDFAESHSVLRPSKADPALVERVTEHVRQRPAQAEVSRKAVRQRYPQGKPEDWDKKR